MDRGIRSLDIMRGVANYEAFVPPHTVSPPSGAATAHTPLPPDVTDYDPADNGTDTGIPIKQ